MFVSFETAVQMACNNIARHRAAMAELGVGIRTTKPLPAPRSVISFKETAGTLQNSCKVGFAKKNEKADTAVIFNADGTIEKRRSRQPYFKGAKRRFSRETIRGYAFLN